MNIKNVHIFGGGTVSHIASHLAVCAPAYGNTAKQLEILCKERFKDSNIYLELTKMAGGSLDTNEDIAARVEVLKSNPDTKVIFFNCALVDFKPTDLHTYSSPILSAPDSNITIFGKYSLRLETLKCSQADITLIPAEKIIPTIRKGRKDIFLVGFKTTCGATNREMYLKGLNLCKTGSVNLVLVNDVKTRMNMIITPEEAAYHESTDRQYVLEQLVDMAWYRSHLTFTQSTVVDGKPVKWEDERVPNSLRTVVNFCISQNAYKPFNNATVGHFAVKLSDTEFLTSIRKSDFNLLHENGLVYVKTSGPDTVMAYGSKPSVGGQSQRIVFNDHEGVDCIVHFHSPLKVNHKDDIKIVSQREVECGSHECGRNTSNGLRQFGNLKAVMLDNHGPNIVFNKNINPVEVINFINDNFDLAEKTGGYNLI